MQSIFFIEVKVIFLKWQINSWLPVKILQRLPIVSRKMSKLFKTRCSWSDSCPFFHYIPSPHPFYMDAVPLKLPFLSTHPSPRAKLSVDPLLLLLDSPTLTLPPGRLDITSCKSTFLTLQSSSEVNFLWYHSNYCAFKIIVLDNKPCEILVNLPSATLYS